MEKEKPKMTESLPKSIIYPFLMYLLCIAEMGILSGYHFVWPVAGGKNGADIGLTGSSQGYKFAQIGTEVGWQFVTMSVVMLLAVLGFMFYLGFKRCLAGGLTITVMNLAPLLGLVGATAEAHTQFTILWGYGTAHWLPLMSMLGLHMPADPHSHGAQVVFLLVVTVLAVGAWLLGKVYRVGYAKKYEYDLSVPLA